MKKVLIYTSIIILTIIVVGLIVLSYPMVLSCMFYLPPKTIIPMVPLSYVLVVVIPIWKNGKKAIAGFRSYIVMDMQSPC